LLRFFRPENKSFQQADLFEHAYGFARVGTGIEGQMKDSPVADRSAGESSKVDTCLGEFLRQLSTKAGLIARGDPDSMQRFCFLKAGFSGCSYLPWTFDGCNEYYSLFTFFGCAAGNNEFQIDIRLGKNVKFLSQSTGLVLDTGGPHINTTDINFHNTFSKISVKNAYSESIGIGPL
jgi:hypothetical protein